jgi:uncharacterized protein (DUF849 family)
MAEARKVIITCAVTGAIHTPSMSPHLPITPEEIADAAVGAAEAGAAIVHLHARDPETGRPDQTPRPSPASCPVIKQRADCVVNLTTGGAPWMSVEERVRPAATLKPEVASLNMGSMNFGLFPMLARYKDSKHDWERQYLEGSRDLVFKNTYKDIEYILRTCAEGETRFEFECYDTAHLYNLAHFLSAASSARRSSSRPCSASWAGSAPTRRTCCTCGAPPTACSATPTAGRSGRRPQPDADRRDGRRDGRQRPRRPGGQPVGRPGPAGESNAAQVRRVRQILDGPRPRPSPLPPRRARCWR